VVTPETILGSGAKQTQAIIIRSQCLQRTSSRATAWAIQNRLGSGPQQMTKQAITIQSLMPPKDNLKGHTVVNPEARGIGSSTDCCGTLQKELVKLMTESGLFHHRTDTTSDNYPVAMLPKDHLKGNIVCCQRRNDLTFLVVNPEAIGIGSSTDIITSDNYPVAIPPKDHFNGYIVCCQRRNDLSGRPRSGWDRELNGLWRKKAERVSQDSRDSRD